MLLQFLVNLRTEQAYAREDGDQAAVERIARRFDALEGHLRQILDDDRAHLQLDRTSFEFKIVLGDGRAIAFDELADGIASVLFLWATLMIPVHYLLRGGVIEPAGWAIIDEPELHLHARLQEMVLPLLTEMHPNVQFIVATHSPEVLASLSNATIFDLRTHVVRSSTDYLGIRYGTILKEHFGLPTDIDRATSRKLVRLKALFDLDPRPGTPEREELRRLVAELSDRPSLLVAQAHQRLEFSAP